MSAFENCFKVKELKGIKMQLRAAQKKLGSLYGKKSSMEVLQCKRSIVNVKSYPIEDLALLFLIIPRDQVTRLSETRKKSDKMQHP